MLSASNGRRASVGVAVAAALAVVLAGPLPASAQDTPRELGPTDWSSAVTDSRLIDSPAIASGVVYRDDGRTPASGAEVIIYAHPPLEDRIAALEGETVDLTKTPLAMTVTGRDGRYALRLDPDVDLDGVRSEGRDVIDARLVARTRDGISFHAFSILPDGTIDDEDVDYADDSEIAVLDEATDAVSRPVHADLEMTRTSAPTGIRTMASGEAAFAPLAKGRCPNGKDYQLWDLGKKWVNVGSVHVGTSKVEARFVYQHGASSTLGVGFSASGKIGSFEASGTSTRESSSTISWPWYKGKNSHHLDTMFRYVKDCIARSDHTGWWHYYEVYPLHHSGGARSRDASVPSTPKDYCVPYLKGGGHVQESTNAITRNAGAKLGKDIGIDLSARTGFRSNAKLQFEFGKTARLCGTHGDPGDPKARPRVLVARSH